MNKDLGDKIKQLRIQREITLEELSKKTELPIELLSQLEQGSTNIDVCTLNKITEALEVDPKYLFINVEDNKSGIVRSYNKELYPICTLKHIQYKSSINLKENQLFTRLVEILPSDTDEKIETYNHSGEEFVYVLEGVLTLCLEDNCYELNTGDSIQYDSNTNHNWANYTNQLVKLLVTSTSNPFK